MVEASHFDHKVRRRYAYWEGVWLAVPPRMSSFPFQIYDKAPLEGLRTH